MECWRRLRGRDGLGAGIDRKQVAINSINYLNDTEAVHNIIVVAAARIEHTTLSEGIFDNRRKRYSIALVCYT